MSEHLFVYGTLHPNRAPAAILPAVQRLVPVGAGSVYGVVHHLGAYPGLLLGGDARVHGEVFTLPDDAETLALLDAYEDFRPHAPECSLFRRVQTAVAMVDGGKLACWVYVWNGHREVPPR